MGADVWNLVLAAGAGKRLAPLTGGIPKQYWRPSRGPSLLDDTINRMAPLAPASRTVTIVAEAHRPHLAAMGTPGRLGHVVFQPEDRGTATGVLLGLMHLLSLASEALVVMTPSDHGVRDVRLFHKDIERAVHAVRHDEAEVVVFGVEPDCAHGDYGWITPTGAPDAGALRRVGAFVEKPADSVARQLLSGGAVWNTMVVVASVRALIDLYLRYLPDLHEAMTAAFAGGAAGRSSRLTAAYPQLPRCDFSHDLLTPASSLSLIVWPRAMGWSDLGTPERLTDWLGRSQSAPDMALASSVSL